MNKSLFLIAFFTVLTVVNFTNAQSLNKSAFLSSGNNNNSLVSNSGQIFTGLSSDTSGNQLLRGFFYQVSMSLDEISDNIPPSVILTDTDSDNIVKNTDLVTITAHFSEHLISAPTISLSGIVTDALMTSDYFDFNQYWRQNQVVNNQPDEPNDVGGENYAYMGIINSPDHPDHNQIVFTDYGSGGDAIRWIIETQSNIEFENQSNYLLIGTHNSKNYWISSTETNDFETLIADIDQNTDIELLAIESDTEYEFLTQVFRSDSSLHQNGPYFFGLVQDTNADDYSEPSGGWGFRNLSYTPYSYTWSVQTSAMTTTTIASVSSATDLAGNTYSGSESITFSIDNIPPKLTIETPPGERFSNTSVVVTLTFDEAITGLTTNILDFSNTTSNVASLTLLSYSDDLTEYLVQINPLTEGEVKLAFSQSSPTITDLAGNEMTDTVSCSWTYDITRPSPTVTATDNLVSISEQSTITLSFNEPITSVTITDVTIIGGGSVSNLTSITSSVFNLTYTPPIGVSSRVSIFIEEGILSDRAGNTNTSSSTEFTVDTVTPTLISSDSDDSDSIVDGEDTVLMTFTFSESMITPVLSISGVVTEVALTVSTSTDSRTWTYIWDVPSGISSDVLVSVTGSDIAGNSSQDSQTLSFTIDNQGPQIISTEIDDDNSLITLVFSEPTYYAYSSSDTTEFFSIITSGGGGDFFATATLDSVNQVNDTTFELGISINGVPTGEEVVTVTPLSDSKLKDFVGNYATSQQSSNTVSLNNQPPYIVSMNISDDNQTVTVEFSESLTTIESVQLPANAFKFSITGESAELVSDSPSNVAPSGNLSFDMTLSYTTEAAGGEILTLSTVISNTIFDSTGAPLVIDSDTTSNSVVLNDRLAPVLDSITFVGSDTLELTFSEPVYGSATVSNSLTASNFSVSLSGQGSATLTSNSPENLSVISASKIVLTIGVTGTATENQMVGIDISDVFDGNGNELNSLSSVVTISFVFDEDGDGVSDVFDACPNTPEGESVNQFGCSANQRDLDGDGVENVDDICPNTPPGVEVNEQGCGANQVDSDRDGIPDVRDNCVDTINPLQKDYDGDGVGDVCDPDPILGFTPPIVREDAIVGSIVSTIQIRSINEDDEISFSIEDEDNVFGIQGNQIVVTGELDYEYKQIYVVKIIATTSSGGRSEELLPISILDVENAFFRASFFIAVFDLLNQLGSGNFNRVNADHIEKFISQSTNRYYNPFNKGVGKWKVRKSISGGNDKGLFVIKEQNTGTRKSGETESEGVLAFIDPPDYKNPKDHNRDNVYEVEVTFINLEDGAPEIPIPVTQNQLQVVESTSDIIQLQSRPALPTDDTDGDGVPDIQDNSPNVSNPDQSDSDGDGVGDVTDDSDHDGVWNPFDQCPDTPYGSFVDLQGCELFHLPPSNFLISKSEGCSGQNSILMQFETSHPYNISVTGSTNYNESFSGYRWKLDNLSQGVYNVCITVEGVDPSDFERCFEVTINDPEPLTVFSSLNDDRDIVNLELNGSDTYNVSINGVTSKSSAARTSISLRKGLNIIQVSTDKDCQGVFEEKYFVSEDVAFSPNPFNDNLSIFVGGKDTEIQIDIMTVEGRLVSSGIYQLNETNRNVRIPTSHFVIGSYLVKVSSTTVDQSFITIKK